MTPAPTIFCNQKIRQEEGLGHKPSHKTFNLQLVLPAESSRTTAQDNTHQRAQRQFIQQLMGTGVESHSQTLGTAWEVLGRRLKIERIEGTREIRNIKRT